jgi:hypothetical protein
MTMQVLVIAGDDDAAGQIEWMLIDEDIKRHLQGRRLDQTAAFRRQPARWCLQAARHRPPRQSRSRATCPPHHPGRKRSAKVGEFTLEFKRWLLDVALTGTEGIASSRARHITHSQQRGGENYRLIEIVRGKGYRLADPCVTAAPYQ